MEAIGSFRSIQAQGSEYNGPVMEIPAPGHGLRSRFQAPWNLGFWNVSLPRLLLLTAVLMTASFAGPLPCNAVSISFEPQSLLTMAPGETVSFLAVIDPDPGESISESYWDSTDSMGLRTRRMDWTPTSPHRASLTRL